MFAGINMFWAQLGLILARAARLITISITLEGTEKIKTEKKKTKHSDEYFFHQHCEKASTNFEMASRF